VHTDAMEQAAHDRLLFLAEAGQGPRVVDLRFPEYVFSVIFASALLITLFRRQFNGGSPWNVPAGHGSANVDAVIEKYRKEAYEQNELRLQQMRDNQIPAEQPVGGLAKLPPATPSA
jgi:hypothetical protein